MDARTTRAANESDTTAGMTYGVPQLADMKHVGPYRVWVKFKDGPEGVIDLKDRLRGQVFEPLKDAAYFRTGRLDLEMNTITWPNGADFAPESLYERVTGKRMVG